MAIMEMSMKALGLLFGRVARALGGFFLLLVGAIPHLANAGTAQLAQWELPVWVSFTGGVILLPLSIGLMISAIWA
jgi:hypothetical protein